jgi:hypothetical protein
MAGKALMRIAEPERQGDGSLFDLKRDKAEDRPRRCRLDRGVKMEGAVDARYKAKSRPAG